MRPRPDLSRQRSSSISDEIRDGGEIQRIFPPSLISRSNLALVQSVNLTMVIDHSPMLRLTGEGERMEEIAISKFKATCLEVLERVRKTRKRILVTRFGQPIAEVLPPSAGPGKSGWLGSMAGTARIKGDIVSPASETRDWEALKK